MTATEHTKRHSRDEWTAEISSTVEADVRGGFDSSAPVADIAAEDMQPLARGMGVLIVKRGHYAGSQFQLDRPVMTVGRHPDSDIFLDDITVSRRHAEFMRDGGSYRVRDVGSLNGTYVNRERTDDAVLAHGDEVQIGKFKLVFFSGGEA